MFLKQPQREKVERLTSHTNAWRTLVDAPPPPPMLMQGGGGHNLFMVLMTGSQPVIQARNAPHPPRDREFIIDNLLVRIHLIIEMSLVDRPCAMGV